MCQIKILKRTKDGILIFCHHAEIYQLLFKNINFNLTSYELESFSKYIQNIDVHYWEQEYRNSLYNKHIPIPSLQANLMLLLDVSDLFELRELLNYQSKEIKIIPLQEIDYKFMLN